MQDPEACLGRRRKTWNELKEQEARVKACHIEEKVDTSHCSMISMLLIVVQATAFALESEPSTDVHEGLSHRLCLKCKFLRYEWSLLLDTWQRTCAKTLRVSEGHDFLRQLCWTARSSSQARLWWLDDCDVWEGVFVAPGTHSQGSGLLCESSFQGPERSWKPLTNVQRKKLEKSGKIQEDLGKLEALERFELLYRAFSVWALQIVAAQVSTCARFLPTRTFHNVQLSSWRRLLTQSSMWGLFSEERSHNICARLHS